MINIKKSDLAVVWLMFGIYAVLFGYLCVRGGNSATEYAWLGLDAWGISISIILLGRHRLPSRKKLLLSALLSILYALGNLHAFNFFAGIQTAFVFIASCACFSTFENSDSDALVFLKRQRKRDIIISVMIGLLSGVVFGGINYFLMKGSNALHPESFFTSGLYALKPGIGEEMLNRCLFYAFCLSFVGGNLASKGKKLTAWFMMIVPHILPHTVQSFQNGNILQWLIILILYILIFGLIFAILQRKRDVASAMIAHGVVDSMRFCIFGLPV